MTLQRTHTPRPPDTELPPLQFRASNTWRAAPELPSVLPMAVSPGQRRTMVHRAFPGEALYAVKCNPHPFALDTFHAVGIRQFDTASPPEIALISEWYSDVVRYFHHSAKPRAAIHTARHVYGIRHFPVDSKAELDKITAETDGGDLAVQVRIATPATRAAIDLSCKFGALPERVPELLRAVAAAGYEPGISFMWVPSASNRMRAARRSRRRWVSGGLPGCGSR